jgi:hypothetical protein
VHAVHPGIVNTDLFDGTLLKTIAPWIPPLFFKVSFQQFPDSIKGNTEHHSG